MSWNSDIHFCIEGNNSVCLTCIKGSVNALRVINPLVIFCIECHVALDRNQIGIPYFCDLSQEIFKVHVAIDSPGCPVKPIPQHLRAKQRGSLKLYHIFTYSIARRRRRRKRST